MSKKNIRDGGFYYVKYRILNQEDILFWNEEENLWEMDEEFYDDLTSNMEILGKVPNFKEWQKCKYMLN